MSAAKHTPAPWTMGNENNQCCDVVLGDKYNLTCSLDRQDANTGDFVISRDEMLANAHLIAAAPELLEALQMFMKAGVGNSSDHGMQCCAANLAKQAIAKAEGKQTC